MKIRMSQLGMPVVAVMVMVGTMATAHADSEAIDGAAIYNSNGCMACHMTGAAGAPIVGQVDTWKAVMEKGSEQVYRNAIEGVGAMPAKGGRMDLSDEEIVAAVDYMFESSR